MYFRKLIIITFSLLLIISCSDKGRDLRIALNNHKNEYGIDYILSLIKEKNLEWALYQSAIEGYSDIVAGLVKFGADINNRGLDGATPLILFCRAGNLEAAKILIENGADVSIIDYNGNNILDNLKNYEDKRILVSYMQNRYDVVGADYLLDISNSDLRFDSDFSWGTYSFYSYYKSTVFETYKNVYLVLTIKALNKDLYVRDNTITAYIYFPKSNNNEYTVNFEKGKLINRYEDENNEYLIYELELELYENINTQNKTINNEFVFKIVANKSMKLPTMLVFPEPYQKNNRDSSVTFY